MDDKWDQFGEDYDYPPFYNIPRTYLIASTPRSGSHFLGHLLLGTGVLGSPLEYLHPVHARTWMARLGASDLRSMLTRLYQRRTSPSGWFGVKAHWAHWAPVERYDALHRFLNVRRTIEIRRRDRIAQAISGVIAQQTGAWISFHETCREPRYDFAAIHRAVVAIDDRIGRWGAYFASRAITPLVVEYEDLIADPNAVVAGILSAFGLDRADIARPKWLPQRQASDRNARWRERYLRDLSEQPELADGLAAVEGGVRARLGA